MGQVIPASISQNATNQAQKAADLQALAERIAKLMSEVDTEIQTIGAGGLEGTSVTAMLKSYTDNREVISDFVKRFSAAAVAVDAGAEAMAKVNTNAETAASGSASA